MAENTKIQWCDHTFNPWRGCLKVASGCANCYAEAQSKRNPKVLGIRGSEASGATRVVAASVQWDAVKHWNSGTIQCSQCGGWHNDQCSYTHCDCGAAIDQHCFSARQRVFVASLADVFEDWQGPMVDAHKSKGWVAGDGSWRFGDQLGARPLTMDDVRARLFALIDDCPNLDFMLLTKRPENIRRFWPAPTWTNGNGGMYCNQSRNNVHLYTSIACQEDADRNIPELLKCRDLAPVLGVSAEPLVGPVDFGTPDRWAATSERWGVNHVIVGGESGPNARPCNVEWIRDIVSQCRAAGVACFVKQLGANVVHSGEDRWAIGVQDKKGGDPAEWPDDLRVREMPLTGSRLHES